MGDFCDTVGGGSKQRRSDAYREVLAAGSLDEAMKLFEERLPEDYCTRHQQVVSVLRARHSKIVLKRYPEESFNVPYLDTDILDKKAVILSGASGTGKTQYAVSQFDKPLFVSHIDTLRTFVPGLFDGLVFDDMSFAHWPVESCIHLFDLDMPRAINVRYAIVTLPAGLHRIFTTNKSFDEIIPANMNEFQRDAIMRRVHVIDEINEPLFNKN